MRRLLPALALLAAALGLWLLLHRTKTVSVAPENNSNPAAVTAAVTAALNSAPPATVAAIESSFAHVTTQAVTATPALLSVPAGRAFPPQVTNMAPQIVLEIVSRAVRNYGQRFGGNPVGSNAEITRALDGDNPGSVNFLNADPAMRVNDHGELIDAWGTPFFFHQLSGTEMEIHSAGPDKIMWTLDDLVTR